MSTHNADFVDTCRHGSPEDECPSCAACAACRGECGVCPYLRTSPVKDGQ